ncbi:transporter substrate-binding domain-containing protein [Ignatzschineria rhizosphaerae]|uniref:Transporter substrate-binding domain-containing protein n=1 Tax=Ignatzschineria rhizosphaerae TaxID=2923279 RepID=A0ABY3X5B7_9GAMM|nr:transporter substrate-binding domain-containing protein [Ignatzschineria rhizosphaerae]UNM96647.1 transporter substrate-binding domain-containing protein [Ignatzschineria rhizosphaerae]
MKKKLGLLLVAAGLLSGTVSLAQEKLTIGTNPAYPPFEYKGENNELLGFDIDLMNEVCNVLQKECVYSEQEFDALIPNLRLRRYDAVISGMDITEERAKQLAFSEPYYLNYSIYVSTADKADSIKNVEEMKIGVLSGSTHQQYIRDTYKDAKVSVYPQYPSAMSDLALGRVDVVFGDGEVVRDYIKENDKLVVVGEKVTDPKYFGQGLGIGVGLRNKALVEEINGALKTIKENGKYDEIYKKWFDQ